MKSVIYASALAGALAFSGNALAQQQPFSPQQFTQQPQQQFGQQPQQQFGQQPQQQFGQQQQLPTQVQPGQQQLAQERTVGPGTQLFVSPATVRQIQQVLSQAGYDPGNVDGQWRQQTQAAVANFQQANGLEPTGQLNLRTLEALGFGQIASIGGGGQGQTGGGQ